MNHARVAFLHRRPARCTSATRGRHCTTGFWPGARAAQLVLRIEDTDRERSTPENVQLIFDSLDWLGIDWDGDPIYQSDERAAPRRGRRSSCSTPGRPIARPPALSRSRRSRRPTATAASAATDEGAGAVRLRMPDEGATVVSDVIRGESAFENVLQDDLVIARADGTPDLPPRRRRRRPRRRHHARRARRRPLLQHAQARADLRGAGRRAADLRAPAAAARSGREEALQAPRRRIGARSPEFGVSARSSDQLPRAAGLGLRRDDDVLHDPSSSRSCSRSSGSPRTRRSSTSRSCAGSTAATCASCRVDDLTARLEEFTGRDRPARRGRDHAGEDLDARRVLAAGRLVLRRSGR